MEDIHSLAPGLWRGKKIYQKRLGSATGSLGGLLSIRENDKSPRPRLPAFGAEAIESIQQSGHHGRGFRHYGKIAYWLLMRWERTSATTQIRQERIWRS